MTIKDLDQVEFEHFDEALMGCVSGGGFTRVLAGWVAETLIFNHGNRPLQECLAGFLREVGWECTPPPAEDAEAEEETLWPMAEVDEAAEGGH